jgi:hypothetical protein
VQYNARLALQYGWLSVTEHSDACKIGGGGGETAERTRRRA